MIFLIVLILLTIIPQIIVRSTYNKYADMGVNSSKTGEQVVQEMLLRNGVSGISINRISGTLTDHYDSKNKSINLSSDNFNNPTIASVAVAAHETGHALQDDKGYLFLRLRHAMGPTTVIASKMSWIAIYLGFIVYFTPLIWFGIVMLGIVVMFDLVTLPVEINASRRAKQYLALTGEYTEEELYGVNKVLSAAAFTYVAVTLAGILQIIRLISAVRKD